MKTLRRDASALALAALSVLAWGCGHKSNGITGVSEVWGAAPADARGAPTIGVEGKRWVWSFEHGELQAVEELVIPAGTVVHLELRTGDGAHRFTIPSLGIDAEAKPGVKSHLWVRVAAPGTHKGICREDCKYPTFFPTVKAVPSDEYKRSLAGADGPPAGSTPAKWGEQLARTKGCDSCHPRDGSRGIGGSLRGLWGADRTLTNGTTLKVAGERGDQYLRDSLTSPTKEVVAGFSAAMPVFSLPAGQTNALVAYMKCGGPACADAACAGVDLCNPEGAK